MDDEYTKNTRQYWADERQRHLSAREERSLEKIAALRGHIGKLRAKIQMAYDIASDDGDDPFGGVEDIGDILFAALELKVEDGT